MDCREEIARRLIISRGDGAKLLEFAEEVFNQMASLVEVFIILTLIFSIAIRWNDRSLAGLFKQIDHTRVGIECLVGDHSVGFEGRKKRISADQIVGLAGREQEAGRIAERVDGGVDFRTQSPSRVTDRLVRTVFLSAPALC